MNRKPYLTSTHTHTKVKAKNLNKKDRVSIFGQTARVIDVDNAPGDKNVGVLVRMLQAPNKKVLVITPKNHKVTVTEHKFKSNPKNR